ncbi:MAG: single-stranded-DNA-specific exonuclease RecJ [Gammaproteobacteria bacterium]|nr:single-stranded-DNA-specific exonuclease RecJ [Gammaproteobacteria bacterium]
MLTVRARNKEILLLNDVSLLAEKICTGRNVSTSLISQLTNLSELSLPHGMKGLEQACIRLEKAIREESIIGILSDHDCDGQTACAVIYATLRDVFDYPADKIFIYIGHRLNEGYGISQGLLARILSSDILPSVIITADCGSSDAATIAELSKHNIDVIVTDHHQIPSEGPPKIAYAVLNPQQEGCGFPDKFVAGCGVAWFLMASLRSYCSQQWSKKLPSLAPMLDFVGIGTLADCVSLTTSVNNRIILKYAFQAIREGRRPCWRVLKQVYQQHIDSDFFIFKIIPLINASGRLGDGLGGVHFLLSEDMVTAQERLAELISINETRKQLQKEQSLLVTKHLNEYGSDFPALVISLAENGHHGIHGVTAGNLCEEHKKLTILLSSLPHDKEILSGSARAPLGWSIKSIFDRVAAHSPNLMIRYGGHHQAGGVLIAKKDADAFKTAVIEECRQDMLQMHDTHVTQAHDIIFDGLLDLSVVCNIDALSELSSILEPFGKDFPNPCFGIIGKAVSGRAIGADKNHLQWSLQVGSELLKACLFFCTNTNQVLEAFLDRECLWIGEFSIETYRGTRQATFMIKHIIRCGDSLWSSAKAEMSVIQFDSTITTEIKKMRAHFHELAVEA